VIKTFLYVLVYTGDTGTRYATSFHAVGPPGTVATESAISLLLLLLYHADELRPAFDTPPK